jgi:hypothetical protein
MLGLRAVAWCQARVGRFDRATALAERAVRAAVPTLAGRYLSGHGRTASTYGLDQLPWLADALADLTCYRRGRLPLRDPERPRDW